MSNRAAAMISTRPTMSRDLATFHLLAPGCSRSQPLWQPASHEHGSPVPPLWDGLREGKTSLACLISSSKSTAPGEQQG
jgi:hypothetical protein